MPDITRSKQDSTASTQIPRRHVLIGGAAMVAALLAKPSDDVLTLTGRRSLSVQEFVKKNAAMFTVSPQGTT